MNLDLALALTYVGQMWLKVALAVSKRAGEAAPPPADPARLTILQPVTSGDETLADNLRAGLREVPGASFFWIIDREDQSALTLCRQIANTEPAANIRLVAVDEPAPGYNPKLWKQSAGLPHITTELVAVIDDDTRVPRRSIDALVAALDRGADLATGLPCYEPARGGWSNWVTEFVNSSAILTYISAARCAHPRSINGMCYMVRTEYARRTNLFTAASRAITDDLAIARVVRRLGGTIEQTTEPQFIRTTVTSARHFRRLMHRWFVFIRILVTSESRPIQLLLGIAYGLHPLLLWGLLGLAIARPGSGLYTLLIVLALRAVTLVAVNRIFTGRLRHAPVASVAMELLQPFFLTRAWLHPIIWWRHRRIRVHGYEAFDYLPS